MTENEDMKDEILEWCGTWDAPGIDADQVLPGVLANADVQDAGDLPRDTIFMFNQNLCTTTTTLTRTRA